MTERRPFEFDNFIIPGDNTAAVLDLSLNRRRPPAVDCSELLENIRVRMDILLDEEKNNNLRLIKMILNELSPQLLEKQSLEIVSHFVAEKFPALGDRKILDFYFHPDTIYQIRPLLEKLAAQNGFAGQIFLHKDPMLSPCDCRIKWQRGEAVFDSQEKIRRLETLLTGEKYE